MMYETCNSHEPVPCKVWDAEFEATGETAEHDAKEAMPFEPHDYVNDDASNAGRKVRYIVRQENAGSGKTRHSVTRINTIGQGWHVANYDSWEAASAVAKVLEAFTDAEVH